MSFQRFEMERWQSTWENRVAFNLSESGVHPMTAAELVAMAGGKAPLDAPLGYPQSNGTGPLRAAIAALYPGAKDDQVLVTSGSAEANYVNCWRLIAPGDRVVIVQPTYMQTWGLATNFGAKVQALMLKEPLGWQPDPADIDAAITPGTRLVVVTNPHNPTGHILSDANRKLIVERAAAVGAWLLADEVYIGAERDGVTTQSFWGSYDKLIVVSGLSKAYGLPGLRIGWLVAPAAFTEEAWARNDYLTIGPPGTSDHLAALALEPKVREKILARTRGILKANYPVLEGWLKGFGDEFRWVAPRAGAICYVGYKGQISATDLVEKIRAKHNVLLCPGDHFGTPRHIRFGFGNEQPELRAALEETAKGVRAAMA